MRLIGRICVVLVAVAAMSSCSVSRYMSKNVNPEEISPMVLVQPLSFMEYVEKDGSVVVDTENAGKNSAMVENYVRLSFPEVSQVVPLENAGNRDVLENELISLSDLNLVQVKKQSGYYYFPAIGNTILEQGYRYGIAVFSSGFTRDPKNYSKELTKSFLLGLVSTIVSLGTVTYIEEANKYGSNVYLMIFDAENNKIVYFGRSVPSEANPLKEKTVCRQVASIRNRYK